MYTDEDLDDAVNQGVFTDVAVAQFRALVAASKNAPLVDEENFKLIGGFNDIFVVMACVLSLSSLFWVLRSLNDGVARAVFVLLAWGLAEVFVRRRKMALPAIVLLLAFVGGVFALVAKLMMPPVSALAFMIAAAVAVVAAYGHWRRFKVPITVAAGFVAGAVALVAAVVWAFPREAKQLWPIVLFVCGCLAFIFAMYWDSADRSRTNYRSDVAFWLHLLAAPLIIHPVFSVLGVLERQANPDSMVAVIGLYLLLTCLSLAVDRRVFMVSSLTYVLYALSNLFKAYGTVGDHLALTGVVIGLALLLLSAFWHSARKGLVRLLPAAVQRRLPHITDAGKAVVLQR